MRRLSWIPNNSITAFLSLYTNTTSIVGDLNVRYDIEAEARPFVQLIDSYHLYSTSQSTHSAGHTLDFLITSKNNHLVTSLAFTLMSTSDQHSVDYVVNITWATKKPTYLVKCNYRAFDVDSFNSDIKTTCESLSTITSTRCPS